jgi:glutamate--cysteine ligase catalytic subunit
MKSIRERRGSKVQILVPVFNDLNTNMTEATYDEPFPGSIYMDSMHFGMGCSCLQVTFEAQSLNHARYIHDMFLPFTPIMAALSQSSPIFKGKLADIDLRWTVISQSVDCRSEEERDPKSAKYIPKSRYSTMNHYISRHQYVKDKYMDTYQYKVNEEHLEYLKTNGLDERLAFHIASLFVRDPIPTYDNELDEEQIDDNETTAHFENLQSTNWNSMRFKPPPTKDSSIGWRVEFRSMDIQLTDFENAAMLVTLGLLYNILNHFDVNFMMPISLIDENMDRAHQREACIK